MDDLIKREDVIKLLRTELSLEYFMARSINKADNNSLAICDKVLELPSAEPKRGKWIYDENGMDWNLGAWVCSECHCRNDNIPPAIKFGNEYKRIADPNMWQGSRFCPNCGADMRGER